MTLCPENLKYMRSHEWVRIESNGEAVVGISDHAQASLGDIVFVELPEVGAIVHLKNEIAVVESVKAASDVYSPVSGEITAINEELLESPEMVNKVPYDGGWFFKIKLSDEAELDDLMDAESYSEFCIDS
ncbi:MAG: glycine cleavage system protein GcvH [Gammaproteobacteria bacterium]|nr:glycine cleavage system protein GcvH [Gammaproteobacteria bacterium]MDG1952885.1 glycine cleavage system protein GcvH [Gammaproteobacteria bacterium]MDG2118996.1 glycine cleavage system protein GcvH [Gammaproteobacteria bacterium]